VNAFFNSIFILDFQPFVKKVVINLRFDGDAFVAFFRRIVSLSLILVSERTFI